MSSVPPDYVKENSFTTLATQPITISGLPGSELDSEFTSVATSVNQTIDRLSLIQQDDGALRNGVVGLESLSVDTKNALAVNGATVRGRWSPFTSYAAGDVVVLSADKYAYMCSSSHTSSSDFNADFSSSVWAIMGYRPATSDLVVNTYTAGASQTAYTLSTNPVSENNTQVFINGVYQSKTVYSISGLILTLATPPTAGAKVEIVTGVAAELINNVVTIPNASVGTLAIVDQAVTGAKIANGTITTGKLADQSITFAKIENNAVGSAKITDLAIITDKLASGSVTNAKLGLLSVNTANIADNAVTTVKILDNSVTMAKIADGSVNQAKASNMLMPTGAVMAFAMQSVPVGWLECRGREYLKTDYPALFAAIGSTYNPSWFTNSATMFCVPDLRGYFVRGYGAAGASGDFGVQQADEIKAHTHGFTNGRTYIVPSPSAGNGRAYGSGSTDYNVTFNAGTGLETRPKNIAMLYCIKY
jgi:hypothetical protein